MKYQKLTDYIKVFSENYSAGKWILAGEKNENDPRPIRIPFIKYDSKIFDFMRDMYGFMDVDYSETLDARGIEVRRREEDLIDVTEADDKEVLALITYVIRAERFNDGEMKSVVESGTMTRWLKRLKEIDAQEAV